MLSAKRAMLCMSAICASREDSASEEKKLGKGQKGDKANGKGKARRETKEKVKEREVFKGKETTGKGRAGGNLEDHTLMGKLIAIRDAVTTVGRFGAQG